MGPDSNLRRSRRRAARVFTLLFVAMLVGFYFTIGADVVHLGRIWILFVLLAGLVLLTALFFLR